MLVLPSSKMYLHVCKQFNFCTDPVFSNINKHGESYRHASQSLLTLPRMLSVQLVQFSSNHICFLQTTSRYQIIGNTMRRIAASSFLVIHKFTAGHCRAGQPTFAVGRTNFYINSFSMVHSFQLLYR